MFDRLVLIEAVSASGQRRLAPLAKIDNFAMRNFTNDAIFDDTLPVSDGRMEIGRRVPVELLRERMEDWFRRKRYLADDERLDVVEIV
ncbi:MAG: hypothetical protein PW792_14705 [Acidobacteriaceae bacterium]|nr:hypothetical protein [Acidobacteriaceae bacterium]